MESNFQSFQNQPLEKLPMDEVSGREQVARRCVGLDEFDPRSGAVQRDATCALKYYLSASGEGEALDETDWDILDIPQPFEQMSRVKEILPLADCFVVTIAHGRSQKVEQVLFVSKREKADAEAVGVHTPPLDGSRTNSLKSQSTWQKPRETSQ